ncbi:MAG: zinc dependent phospholipase C family protein [Clostridiales bacterium]|nr:zinc dependent phospholipase C family protein [Clostridiales bacterium]
MPAIYAHDLFGVRVQEQMEADLAAITERYPSAYREGLQGPDIFFFYHPWYKNRVQRYGVHLHKTDAGPLFRHVLSVIRRYGRDSSQYAYMLGFICHFALDSECHPYIEEQIERSGVAHLEMEVEFEKFLLRENHLDPVGFRSANLVYTDSATAAAIAPFFPSMDEKKVQDSLRGMRFVKKLFCAPGALKQGTINSILRLIGQYHEMNGLMNQRTDNPACEESNLVLRDLFEDAIPLTASLQRQFDQCLRTGVKLPGRFHRNFE